MKNVKKTHMKYLFFLLSMISLTGYGQILPVEQEFLYEGNSTGIIKDFEEDGIKKIKDINNVLGVFLGNWKAVIDNENGTSTRLTLKVERSKRNYSFLDLEQDILIVKFHIEEKQVGSNSWTTVINTLNLPVPNNTSFIIGSALTEKGLYRMDYLGVDAACGQEGLVYLIPPKSSVNKLSFVFAPKFGGVIDLDSCSNGIGNQVLPDSTVELEIECQQPCDCAESKSPVTQIHILPDAVLKPGELFTIQGPFYFLNQGEIDNIITNGSESLVLSSVGNIIQHANYIEVETLEYRIPDQGFSFDSNSISIGGFSGQTCP